MSILITLITNDNVHKIIQGQKDTALNDHGLAQADITGAYLRHQNIVFDEIWSSDLQRAYKTACIIAEHQPEPITVQTDSRLRERFLGDLQGKRWTPNADQSTAEPPTEVLARLLSFWTDLTTRLDSNPSTNPRRILLVSHGAALRTLVQLGLRPTYAVDPSVPQPIVFGNCSITNIEHSPRRLILCGGDSVHLDSSLASKTKVDESKDSVDDLLPETRV
ncbi:hypothetical protein CROQUDRAFT_671531 [Cronartium quercuum f. sp. fusiforme G11]|uniref:Phosphoglycerate mutase n=1 Tax=Cronartium quercuum f. sp. fusiforme G11 TaxID=708437 RepID=A0A9P6TCN6_9BASI|nr:hypothetical protein CROQUDRAFT_671531 [Cronartium quercuum f. sp. fusiforme G11]